MPYFKAIAAMAQNRVIGRNNQIPWHLPEDFKWFKQMTIGAVVVMGRRTFESIGKPLPHRDTIVVSRTKSEIPGVRVVSSLSEVDPFAEQRPIYICGGAHLYAEALPACSDLYLTRVKLNPEGDTLFPPFEKLFQLKEILARQPEFTIEHYVNLTPMNPPTRNARGLA
jgi:dihydrofolate reductase